MKSETIWKSLTDIRDEYVEEAALECENTANELKMPKKSIKKRVIGWGALAASLAIVATAAYPTINRLLSPDPIVDAGDDAYANYPTRLFSDYSFGEEACWRIMTFDYVIDGESVQYEFPLIEWEGETYMLSQSDETFVSVSEEETGELLGATDAVAYSLFDGGSAEFDATIYTCEGIDPAYGVVVRLEGVEGDYLYRSGKYADSLDELIEKAGYRTLLTTSPYIFHTTQDSTGETVQLVFEGMTADILWDELLSYGETVDYDGDDSKFLRISIGHELLQYESVLCLSEDGYITFGALKAGKAVYVGKERARAFLDYLEENLTGYRLVEEMAQSSSYGEEHPEQVVTVTTSTRIPE